MIELQYKKTADPTWLVATANFVDTYTITGLDEVEYQVRKRDTETGQFSDLISIIPDGSGSAVIDAFYYNTEGLGDMVQPMSSGFYPQLYYDSGSNHTYGAFMGKPFTPHNREPFAFKINHITGAVSSPVGAGWLTENEDDNHMEPTCIVAPDGHLLVATEDRHDSQIYIRRSVNPVPDISTFTENFAIVPATEVNYAYSSFVKKGTDLYLFVQDSRRLTYHKSTDSGATWGAAVIVLDLGDDNNEVFPRVPVQSETGDFHIALALRRSIEGDYPDGFYLKTSDFVTWSNHTGTFTKDVSVAYITKAELDANNFSLTTGIGYGAISPAGNPYFIRGNTVYYYDSGVLSTKTISYGGPLISYSDSIFEWFSLESVNGVLQIVRFRTEDQFDTQVKIQELSRFDGVWSERVHLNMSYMRITQNSDANKLMFAGSTEDTDHGDLLLSEIKPITLAAATPEAPVISALVEGDTITASWNYTLGNTSFKLYVSTDNFATHVSGYDGKVLTKNNDTVDTLTPGATYSIRVKAVNTTGESGFSNTTTVLIDSGIGLNPKDPSIAGELAICLSAYDITSADYVESEGVKKLSRYPNTANSSINYSGNDFFQTTAAARPVFDDVNKKVVFSGTEWLKWGAATQFLEYVNNYDELFFVIRITVTQTNSHIITCYRAQADQRIFRISQNSAGRITLTVHEDDLTSKAVGIDGNALGWHTVFCWIKDGEIGIQVDKLTPVIDSTFASIEKDNAPILTIAGSTDGTDVTSGFPIMEQSHHYLYLDPSRNNKTDRDLMHDYFESLGQP